MAIKIRRKLDDGHVSALRDFEAFGFFWDTEIRALRVYIGKHRVTWSYFQQHRTYEYRSATVKVLGHWPEMNALAARRAALVEAGKIADKKITPGKRRALKLGEAMDDYMQHLRAKAAKKKKPARHAANVEKLRRQFFVEFEKWPLVDLSNTPTVVRDWHRKITEEAGPISANRAAEVLRACYRNAYKLDTSLPSRLPTAGVTFNSEDAPGGGMPTNDFPKWRRALDKLPPIHRAFALLNLLTGCRPGELARLQWSDILPRERVLVIRNAKAGKDIHVPLSVPIIRALKAFPRELADVFPGCAQVGHRLELPYRGIELRRTYRTIAAGLNPPVDEMIAHFLMGHAPTGISQRYVARMILASMPAMREAQQRISARIVALLNPTVRAPALVPDGPKHTEVSLLPELP